MPELILLPFIIGLLCFPLFGAYYFAKHLGRNPWFWLGISFVLPIVSLIILIFLPDIDKEAKIDEA
jgi:ABC-type multidrug transport system permease subunit